MHVTYAYRTFQIFSKNKKEIVKYTDFKNAHTKKTIKKEYKKTRISVIRVRVRICLIHIQ